MIKNVFTLNTVHLMESTFDILSEEAMHEEAHFERGKTYNFLKVYNKRDDGFIIMLDKEYFKEAIDRGDEVPFDLCAILYRAIENNCDCICIADDEETLMSLPRFEYEDVNDESDIDKVIVRVYIGCVEITRFELIEGEANG